MTCKLQNFDSNLMTFPLFHDQYQPHTHTHTHSHTYTSTYTHAITQKVSIEGAKSKLFCAEHMKYTVTKHRTRFNPSDIVHYTLAPCLHNTCQSFWWNFLLDFHTYQTDIQSSSNKDKKEYSKKTSLVGNEHWRAYWRTSFNELMLLKQKCIHAVYEERRPILSKLLHELSCSLFLPKVLQPIPI